MSSYKGHSIFALILALMFFQNPTYIALTIIGANIPDFDHEFKKDNVYKMIILGLVIFIILYILNLPVNIALIIIFLGFIFYFSNHRSFTHSIFGILTLTACCVLLLIWSFNLIASLTISNDYYFIMNILIILLSFLFLNKKILMIFIPLFCISLFIIPLNNFSYIGLILSLFLGMFSHSVLDSFTPSGVKFLTPISSKKVFKYFGISSVLLLICFSFIRFYAF